jgi:hypothetical protein
MAFTYTGQNVTLEAGQDLSSSQFYFVAVAADGQVDPAGAGVYAEGVLQNDPDAAGLAANVQISGITKVVAGGAVSVGDAVASNASGKAATAGSGDTVLGTALEAATADGDIIAVLFQPRGAA